jgi:hypothetical protein
VTEGVGATVGATSGAAPTITIGTAPSPGSSGTSGGPSTTVGGLVSTLLFDDLELLLE